MIVLVCGGRDYRDKECLFKQLSYFHVHANITFLINGGASGADTLSTLWALDNQIPFKEFKAKWKDLEAPGAVIKHGRFGPYNAMAGFDRNQKMIDEGEPEYAIAFPGGDGTADMIERIKEAWIDLLEISET